MPADDVTALTDYRVLIYPGISKMAVIYHVVEPGRVAVRLFGIVILYAVWCHDKVFGAICMRVGRLRSGQSNLSAIKL